MKATENHVAICHRVADMAEPDEPCAREACASCKADVWISYRVIHEIVSAAKDGDTVGAVCVTCAPRCGYAGRPLHKAKA